MSTAVSTAPNPLVAPCEGAPTIHADDGVAIQYLLVTADMADAWLRMNTRNRPLSERSVAGYVRDIDADDWPFTGDPIRFAEDGTLLDGQHRLTAISRTGKPMWLVVIFNLGEHTQRYMDGGRKRTPGDELAIRKIPNYVAVAAIARVMILWNPKGFWDSAMGCQMLKSVRVPTVPEVLKFVDEYPGIHDAAKQATAIQTRLAGAKSSVVGAAYMRAMTLEREDIVFETARWFQQLGTGEELRAGHPLLALRQSITRAKDGEKSSGGNAQAPLLFKIVRAWNATVAGDTLTMMQLPRGGLTALNFPDMH